MNDEDLKFVMECESVSDYEKSGMGIDEFDLRFVVHARVGYSRLCTVVRDQDKRARHAEAERDAFDKRIEELESEVSKLRIELAQARETIRQECETADRMRNEGYDELQMRGIDRVRDAELSGTGREFKEHDHSRKGSRVGCLKAPRFYSHFVGKEGTVDHERRSGSLGLHFVHVVFDGDPDPRPIGFHSDELEFIS